MCIYTVKNKNESKLKNVLKLGVSLFFSILKIFKKIIFTWLQEI